MGAGGASRTVQLARPASDGYRQPGRSRARLPAPDAGRSGLGGRGHAAGRTKTIIYNAAGPSGQYRCSGYAPSALASHSATSRCPWNPTSALASASRHSFGNPNPAPYTSSMADPITFRPTAEDTENLAILTADGISPTHAIRHALEIAAHQKRQEDLRADAARLAANPEYQAEIRAVREELDELRAW
jgi:hypothetical protein